MGREEVYFNRSHKQELFFVIATSKGGPSLYRSQKFTFIFCFNRLETFSISSPKTAFQRTFCVLKTSEFKNHQYKKIYHPVQNESG